MGVKQTHVVLKAFDLVHQHAPGDASPDGRMLVVGEVIAGAVAQQHENLLQFVAVRCLRLHFCRDLGMHEFRVPGNVHELMRNILRAQYEIGAPGRNGAGGHTPVPGGVHVLDEGDATGGLDCHEALCTVRGTAGEDNADGIAALVIGQ